MQAQEFGPAKWGLGLRLPETITDSALDKAFDAGRILRTHVMRPTWHFVTAKDIRWMLELTGPRVLRTVSQYCRNLGLEPAVCTRAVRIFERALDGQALTRAELSTHLEHAGIRAKGIALAMLTIVAELEGVICSGPRRGKNQTYAQLASCAPKAIRLSRDEALAEITSRFFRSHGPATIRDFAWWSGLTIADTKRGLDMNRAQSRTVNERTYWSVGNASCPGDDETTVHLLPIYDEYLVSYKDRDAVPHGPRIVKSGPRDSVTFQHSLIVGGHVAGTWRMAQAGTCIDVYPLRRLTRDERDRIAEAGKRYSRFTGTTVSVSIDR